MSDSSHERKVQLYKLTTLVSQIPRETGYPRSKIKSSTVKNLINQGYKDNQIFALYEVSCLDSTSGCAPIPIGILRNLALRFDGLYFDLESIDSLVDGIITIMSRNRLRRRCCNATLITKALKIAEEHEVASLADLEDLLVEDFFYTEEIDNEYAEYPERIEKSLDENPPWVCELLETGRNGTYQ